MTECMHESMHESMHEYSTGCGAVVCTLIKEARCSVMISFYLFKVRALCT